jgi:hypothetical protein
MTSRTQGTRAGEGARLIRSERALRRAHRPTEICRRRLTRPNNTMTESRGIVEVTCQLNDSATCRGDRYRLMMVFAVLNYRYFRRLNMAAADLSISTLCCGLVTIRLTGHPFQANFLQVADSPREAEFSGGKAFRANFGLCFLQNQPFSRNSYDFAAQTARMTQHARVWSGQASRT